MIRLVAQTKTLEEDGPLTFARGVLDQIIAKYDPEAVRESCVERERPTERSGKVLVLVSVFREQPTRPDIKQTKNACGGRCNVSDEHLFG